MLGFLILLQQLWVEERLSSQEILPGQTEI